MQIYIGHLSYDATADDVRRAFGHYGQVASVCLTQDRFSGHKGFGWVDMPSDTEARLAIDQLNGCELKGRAITVRAVVEAVRTAHP